MPQRLYLRISVPLVYLTNLPWKRIRRYLIVYFSIARSRYNRKGTLSRHE
jgi:hypothetical protein